MKTTIHTYAFDTNKPDEAAAYATLAARLRGMGLRFFHVNASDIGGDRGAEAARQWKRNIAARDGQEVTLETAHIFGDQWNSTECGRVFDWYEGIYYGAHGRPTAYKSGHWLEMTDEMRAVRADTMTCGYCGKQEHRSTAPGFCAQCLDSEYLKADELHLLRMLPAAETFGGKRAPLTDEERAEILPRYHAAQGIGKTRREEGRMSRARARIIEERDEAPRKAEQAVMYANIRAAGLLWLLDRGFDADNAIFYTHTERFGLGWKKPLAEIPDYMSEFPYPYDAKLADGRKLSAER